MRASLELLLGVFERDATPHAAKEDFEGEHGEALRMWQRLGFLAREPMANPVPGCPYCGEGEPYRCQVRILCNRCLSTIDHRHLLVWGGAWTAFGTCGHVLPASSPMPGGENILSLHKATRLVRVPATASNPLFSPYGDWQ